MMCVYYDRFYPDTCSQLAECKKHLQVIETALTEDNTYLHPSHTLRVRTQLYKAVLTVRSASQEQVPEYLVNEAVASGKRAETHAAKVSCYQRQVESRRETLKEFQCHTKYHEVICATPISNIGMLHSY